MAQSEIDFLHLLSTQNIINVSAEEDLTELLYKMIEEDKNDYFENVIVFPGKRPKYYLLKKISEKIKNSFIPPRIFSMDEFVDFCFKNISGAKPIKRIDAVGVIYNLCKDELPSTFYDFDRFVSYGFKILNLLEELYIEMISLDSLKRVESLIDSSIVKSTENLRFLSSIYEKFYDYLKNNNLSTRALRYRTVAESDIMPYLNFKRLVFAGFYALTNSEIRILKKFSQYEGFYYVFQSIGDFNDEKIKIYSCSDDHGQVKIAGEIIRRLYSVPPHLLNEKTVIVLPSSEKLFPLLRFGIPFMDEEKYNISMGYPLTRTPIYAFFNELFEVIRTMENENIYIPTYLNFILHPYIKNILFNGSSEAGRIIIHTVENFFTDENINFTSIEWIENTLPSKIEEIAGIPKNAIGQHLKNIHDKTIRNFLKIENIADFAKKCLETLIFIKNHSTAHYHPYFIPYVERFFRVFDEISLSLIGSFSFKNLESYFTLFQNTIKSERYPFLGIPLKGLQILGFLETRNIKFERVIFLDLNEEIFPDLSEDYIIPFFVRKQLGLPTITDREKLQFYYFSLLIQGAKEVHLIYKRDEKTERSRFIERIIWEIEKRKKCRFDEKNKIILLRNYRLKLDSLTPSEIKKNDEIMKVIENIVFSPSCLDEYIKCGLKFYYRNILLLKSKEDISKDLDRSHIGTIVHYILRDYFGNKIGYVLSEKILSDDIEVLVNRFFQERFGGVILGKVYLMKNQILKKMREIVEFYKNLSEKHKIIVFSVETWIEGELFGAKFGGKIDRIDSVDNKTVIIDYKISSKEDELRIDFKELDLNNRESWYRTVKSLQIPIYMLLYMQNYGKSIEELEGKYFLLGKPSVFAANSFYSPFDNDNILDKIEKLKVIINTLINEIKNPNITFKPTQDFKKFCQMCDFKPICGIKLKG